MTVLIIRANKVESDVCIKVSYIAKTGKRKPRNFEYRQKNGAPLLMTLIFLAMTLDKPLYSFCDSINFLNNACTDIDECEEQLHSCGHVCVNTNGSYECACKEGYSLRNDGSNCRGIVMKLTYTGF